MAGRTLVAEQLGDHLLANGDRQVAVAEGAPQARLASTVRAKRNSWSSISSSSAMVTVSNTAAA